MSVLTHSLVYKPCAHALEHTEDSSALTVCNVAHIDPTYTRHVQSLVELGSVKPNKLAYWMGARVHNLENISKLWNLTPPRWRKKSQFLHIEGMYANLFFFSQSGVFPLCKAFQILLET